MFHLFISCSQRVVLDEMDFERPIQIQRDALLRQVAKWFAVVDWLSLGSNRLPRWVRSLIVYLLRPAEAAADCLVGVVAHLLAHCDEAERARLCSGLALGTSDLHGRPRVGANLRVESDGSNEETICSDSLIARMQALKDKLEDLPGHALRLMCREKGQPARRNRQAKPTWHIEVANPFEVFFSFQNLAPYSKPPFGPS